MLSLAKTQSKYFIQPDGDYVMTPYGPLNKQFKDPLNYMIKDEAFRGLGQGFKTH
jgi:hypothetical protein